MGYSNFEPCLEGPANGMCDVWWDGECKTATDAEVWCVADFAGRGDLNVWYTTACIGGTRGDCAWEWGMLQFYFNESGAFIGGIWGDDTPSHCNDSYTVQYGDILTGCDEW